MGTINIETTSLLELNELASIAIHGREDSKEMKAINHLLSDLAYLKLKSKLIEGIGFDVDEFKRLSSSSPYQALLSQLNCEGRSGLQDSCSHEQE